jgi:rhodanese-related sulfurtransferase
MTRKKSKMKNQQMIVAAVAAVILLGAVAGVLLVQGPAPVSALPREVSVQEAYELRETDAFILDVRTPEEWEAGHIPGATLIPLDELEARLAEVPRGEEIVVICRSGNRSAAARDILLQAGFEAVTSVAGGFNQWMANGFPSVTGP